MLAERVLETAGNPLQELQARIQEPLAKWAEARRAISQFTIMFYGENGPFEQYIQEQLSTVMQAQQTKYPGRSMGEGDRSKLEANIRREAIYFIHHGKLSRQSADNSLKHHQKQLATYPEALKQSQDSTTLLNDQIGSVAEHTQVMNQHDPTIHRALTQTLGQHPHLVLELPGLFNNFTEFSSALAAFIASDQRNVVTNTLRKLTESEVRSPSTRMLFAYLKNAAVQYYLGNRQDRLWEMIELALDKDEAEIRDTFTHPQPDETNQASLLAPLIAKLVSRPLPQLLRERFALFMNNLQADTSRLIQEAASKHKIAIVIPYAEQGKEKQTIGYRRKSRPETAAAPQASNGSGQETPQTEDAHLETKKIIIGSVEIAADKIKETLKEFFAAQKVKLFTPTDLENYALIIAKLSGIAKNAPDYDLKKLHAAYGFMDESPARIPLYILRRKNKDAPRLIVAISANSFVIVDAFDRNDHSYNSKYLNKLTGIRISTLAPSLN